MSQSNRGQLQFVPCMCPVNNVNGQQRPAYTSEYFENRENRDDRESVDEMQEERSETPEPKPIEDNEKASSPSQNDNEPIQESVV